MLVHELRLWVVFLVLGCGYAAVLVLHVLWLSKGLHIVVSAHDLARFVAGSARGGSEIAS